jgi:histidine triad (HIT) family protein
MTIFEKIAVREVPARMVHEDADFFAFHDVNPQAPVHVLIVPRRVIARFDAAEAEVALLLGKMLRAAPQIARKLGIAESGFRIVINNGPDAGESVPHLHIHLLGGRALAWPPG